MEPQTGVNVPEVVQVLAIGDANVELVFSNIEKIPPANHKVVVPNMVLRPAGSAANFAICASTLKVKSAFAGTIAVDQFGEVVLKAFRDSAVDTRCLRLLERSQTGVTVVLVQNDGKRTSVTYQGTNAQLQIKDIENCLQTGSSPRWVHLSGYHILNSLRGQPAISLLQLARSRGATTSLDPGWDPRGWSEETISLVKETLQHVDVFFPNADEVKVLTGEVNPRKGAEQLLKAGVPALVVKLGAKGCLLITKHDQHHIPAFDVEVVDTTAAGDAFNAGFAVSMLSGATMGRAAVFANAVAALRISRHSDQPTFPNLQETTAFLMRKRPLET
ncbi:MAG: carbohydrate kinase family protein [Candidatus Thorarchaeota archaeon]